MTAGSMASRTLAAALALIAVSITSTDGRAQDDSCPLANDRICQEAPYGMPPVCPALTDTTDCRTAQIAYGSEEWRLDPADLLGRSPDWLRLARNEIFARHGRPFNSPDLDTLFRTRDWYQPIIAEIVLSDVEQDNVALLARFEQNPIFPLTDAGWPEPAGSWTAMLEVTGEPPRPIMGFGGLIRLEPTLKDGFVSLMRTDHDLVYGWTTGENTGSAVGLGGFVDVPLTARTLAAYGVTVGLDAQSVLDGEAVQSFTLSGVDDGGQPIFEGVVSVTQDGIVVEADYRYLYQGCCGDEPEWRQTHYRLTGLERVPLDPSLFEPPLMEFVMAG